MVARIYMLFFTPAWLLFGIGAVSADEKPLTLSDALALAKANNENALMLRERVARAENAAAEGGANA